MGDLHLMAQTVCLRLLWNGGTNNIGYFAAGSISGTRNEFPISPDCNCGGHADENENKGKSNQKSG